MFNELKVCWTRHSGLRGRHDQSYVQDYKWIKKAMELGKLNLQELARAL